MMKDRPTRNHPPEDEHTKIDPFLQNYSPSDLQTVSEILSNWLPFLSKGLCDHCSKSISDRVHHLNYDSQQSYQENEVQVSSPDHRELHDEIDTNDIEDTNSLGIWKDGANSIRGMLLEDSILENSIKSARKIEQGHLSLNMKDTVYNGSYRRLEVAVKIIRKRPGFSRLYNTILQTNDHPNVLRFYDIDSYDDHFKLAFAECKGSLAENHHVISDDRFGTSWISFVRGIISGLNHLHDNGYHHTNLNPHNIMVSDTLVAKISGLSNCVYSGDVNNAQAGWDSYCFARILLFCFSKDSEKPEHAHRFPDEYDYINRYEEPYFQEAQRLPKGLEEIKRVIMNLLSPSRNSLKWVETQFWLFPAPIRLKYIGLVSDELQRAKTEIQNRIEGCYTFPNQSSHLQDWGEFFEEQFITDMEKNLRKLNPNSDPQYYYHSVRSLLRFLRNFLHHKEDIKKEDLEALGSSHEELFESIIRRKFPGLFQSVYDTMGLILSGIPQGCETLSEDSDLRKYHWSVEKA